MHGKTSRRIFLQLSCQLFTGLCNPQSRLKLEYCARQRIKLKSTAFDLSLMKLTLTSDLDLQSHESYGANPYTRKRSRSKVTWLKS